MFDEAWRAEGLPGPFSQSWRPSSPGWRLPRLWYSLRVPALVTARLSRVLDVVFSFLLGAVGAWSSCSSGDYSLVLLSALAVAVVLIVQPWLEK